MLLFGVTPWRSPRSSEVKPDPHPSAEFSETMGINVKLEMKGDDWEALGRPLLAVMHQGSETPMLCSEDGRGGEGRRVIHRRCTLSLDLLPLWDGSPLLFSFFYVFACEIWNVCIGLTLCGQRIWSFACSTWLKWMLWVLAVVGRSFHWDVVWVSEAFVFCRPQFLVIFADSGWEFCSRVQLWSWLKRGAVAIDCLIGRNCFFSRIDQMLSVINDLFVGAFWRSVHGSCLCPEP